jgi:hypothetical protein
MRKHARQHLLLAVFVLTTGRVTRKNVRSGEQFILLLYIAPPFLVCELCSFGSLSFFSRKNKCDSFILVDCIVSPP